jgi:hypothetical protein
MRQVRISNEQWNKMVRLLRQDARAYIGDEDECRRYVEAVLWITHSGASWRFRTSMGPWPL